MLLVVRCLLVVGCRLLGCWLCLVARGWLVVCYVVLVGLLCVVCGLPRLVFCLLVVARLLLAGCLVCVVRCLLFVVCGLLYGGVLCVGLLSVARWLPCVACWLSVGCVCC